MLCEGEKIELKGSLPNTIYLWQNSIKSDSIEVTKPGVYWAIQGSECDFSVDSFVVENKICDCLHYVPNAFSPNSDNLNDEFKIIGAFKTFEIAIADRWGNIVFKSSNTEFGWDGKYKCDEMPIGTYYYFVKYSCNDSKIRTTKGDLLLIR